jgi:hypothetical protein
MITGLFTTGQLSVADAGVIAGYANGLPFNAAGAVCVALGGTPAGSGGNGLRFDANGRLVVNSVAAIDHWENGLPFCADGALAVAPAGAIDHYANGLAFTVADRLVTT